MTFKVPVKSERVSEEKTKKKIGFLWACIYVSINAHFICGTRRTLSTLGDTVTRSQTSPNGG